MARSDLTTAAFLYALILASPVLLDHLGRSLYHLKWISLLLEHPLRLGSFYKVLRHVAILFIDEVAHLPEPVVVSERSAILVDLRLEVLAIVGLNRLNGLS